jgi:cytochrome P450
LSSLLAAQGITSGRLWDKATTGLLSRDGADHNRLRRLVSQAFTPRSTARLQSTIVEVITELVDPVTITGRCDAVADIARRYPIPIGFRHNRCSRSEICGDGVRSVSVEVRFPT